MSRRTMRFEESYMVQRFSGESMDTFGVYGHKVNGNIQRAAGIIDSVYDRILFPGPKEKASDLKELLAFSFPL